MALEATVGGDAAGRVGVVDRVKTRFSGGDGDDGGDRQEFTYLNPKIAGGEWNNPFRLGDLTGTETTLDWRGNEVQVAERRSSFPPELIRTFSDGLKGELIRLKQIRETDPAKFQRFMSEPYFRPYKEFLDQFVTLKEGSATVGGHAMEEFDDGGFKTYMETDAGFLKAVEMAKIKLQETSIHASTFVRMNLSAETPGPGDPYHHDPRGRGIIEGQDVNTGSGGPGREAGRWIGHKLRERFTTYGRETPVLGARTKGEAAAAVGVVSAVAGAVGTVAFGPLGLAAGMSLPPALAELAARTFRRGERVTIEQTEVAWALAQAADPVRQEFALDMWGVSASNFEVVNGEVRIRRDIRNGTGLATPTKDPESVRDIIIGLDAQIREAQEHMGIKRQHRAGMDLQGISGQRQFIQRDLLLETRVEIEWMHQLTDLAGERCQIERSPGNWVNNPNFNLRNVDHVAVYNLRRDIHSRLLAEDIRKDFEDIAEWGKTHREDLTSEITTRKARYGKDGALAAERIREIDKEVGENGNLKKDGEILDASIKPFDAFEERHVALDEKERAVSRVLGKITKADSTAYENAREISEAINNILLPPASGTTPEDIMIGNARIRPISELTKQIDKIVGDAMREWETRNPKPTRPTPAGKSATPAEKAQYARDKEAFDEWPKKRDAHRTSVVEGRQIKGIEKVLTDQEAILNNFIADLNKAETELADEEGKATGRGAENTTRTDVNTMIADMRTDLSTVEGWSAAAVPTATPPVTAIDLSSAALRAEDIDVLMKRINEANGRDAKVGWPKEANGEKDNRQQLLRAMAEARVTPQTAEFAEAIDHNRWRLTEYDLMMLDTDDIRDLMQQRLPSLAGAVLPTDAQIDDLRRLARDRFEERQNAVRDLKRETDNRKRLLSGEIAQIQERGMPKPDLEAIERAAGRVDDINTTIMDMPVDQLIERLSTDRASTEPGLYSTAEKANNQSIAYANIMEWLFNHRKDTEASHSSVKEKGPEAAFARNSSFMQETVLRDLMVEWFELGAAPSLEAAVQIVRQRLQNGDMAKKHFAEFLTEGVIYGYMAPRVPVL